MLEFRPRWASHCVGTYEARVFDEDGVPEPQRIDMLCEHCGATFRTTCNSGAVRAWVNRFATQHLHKDVLDPARVAEMKHAGAELAGRGNEPPR